MSTKPHEYASDPSVAFRLSAGSGFRDTPQDTSRSMVRANIERATYAFSQKYELDHEEPTFIKWVTAINFAITEQLNTVALANPGTDLGNPFHLPAARHARTPRVQCTTAANERIGMDGGAPKRCLTDIHRRYVLVDVDKTSHDIIAVCRHFYVRNVVAFLDNADDFKRVWVSYDAITADILKKLLSALHEDHYAETSGGTLAIPTFYLSVKIHKNPYKFRNIANSGNGLYMFSKLVGNITALLLDTLRKEEVRIWGTSCPPTWWITANAKDCLSSLHMRMILDVRTLDVEGMYNNINHANLWRVFLLELHSVTAAPLSGQRLPIEGVSVSWEDAVWRTGTDTSTHTANARYYPLSKVKRLVKIVIFDYYVTVCNALFKMLTGVAIGAYASGALADLYMHHFEKLFVYRHVSLFYAMNEGPERPLIRMKRYRDDILACNCPFFERIAKYVYPPDLSFTTGENEGQECTYLDARIRVHNRTLISELYNKWESSAFRPICFPHVCSNVHVVQSHKCLLSDLMRIYGLCTYRDDFLRHCMNRLVPVLAKGYDIETLRHVCMRVKDTDHKYPTHLRQRNVAQHDKNDIGHVLAQLLVRHATGIGGRQGQERHGRKRQRRGQGDGR
jgi:hypothetical protein